MRSLRFTSALVAIVSATVPFACSSSDSDTKKTPSTGTDGGLDSGAGGSADTDGGSHTGTGGSAQTDTDGGACTVTLSPSKDDLATIQGALDTDVKSGSVVCFTPGTYKLQNHIALSAAAHVTFRGTGAKREDVLFDFTGQTAGEEGILVTTDDFTIENVSIKNTAQNGIKVQAANSVFRNIKVSWDVTAGASPDAGPVSGAYAIYPTNCTNTLMEDNEVTGASDAGIYAGQCDHVIARRNNSHGNVLGIEIENTRSAEVYDNEVHGNTCGFLLDLLPDLQKKTAKDYLVHDNHVYDNNLPNFAKKNSLAAVMPQGTGVLVLAASDVEITKNKIEDNGGVGVIIVSYDIIDILATLQGGSASVPDPETNRWPTSIFVHDNTYTGNGTAPDPNGPYALFAPTGDAGARKVQYDVLWDGILGPDTVSAAAARICLGETEQATFVNFHADTSLLKPDEWTTGSADNQCTIPAVPPLTP